MALYVETDQQLHVHCQTCVRLKPCCQLKTQRYGCAVIACPQGCGHQFHSCKTEEHLLLCELVKTPCINAGYGCPLWMQRRELGVHLRSCPASVIYCNMERNRKPVNRRAAKQLKTNEAKPDAATLADPALDLSLALSDQLLINRSYRIARTRRKASLTCFNKRHPALPLLNEPTPTDADDNDDDDRSGDPRQEENSSDDENYGKKTTVSPVARECILCKIDPSSQHLHQLGGGVGVGLYDETQLDENGNEAGNGAKSPPKIPPPPPKFYADLRLLVDLSADFLACHYPKGSGYYTIVCHQSMRRDQYGWHFANVHNDIVGGLDGWAVSRCPLWQYGCRWYTERLTPDNGRRVCFNRYTDGFAVRHQSSSAVRDDREDDAHGALTLLDLPYDALLYVCSLLDSSSLLCLSSTCRELRDFLRGSLLPSKGLVERVWSKGQGKTAGGRTRWVAGPKRWTFAKCFEPIADWRLRTSGDLLTHLAGCPFNDRLVRHEQRYPVLTFVGPIDENDPEFRPRRRRCYADADDDDQ